MPRKNPNTAGDAQLAKGLQNNEGQMQKMRKDPTYSPTPEGGSSGNRAAQKGNARSTATSKPKGSRPTTQPTSRRGGTGMTPTPPISGKVTPQQPESASSKQRSEKGPVPILDPKKNKALIGGLQRADNTRELKRIGRTPGASPRPMPNTEKLVEQYTGKVAVKAKPKKLKPQNRS